MLKILWFGIQDDEYNARGIPDLKESLGKITSIYSYKPNGKIDVKKLFGKSDYDVIVLDPTRKILDHYINLDKWEIPKIMICSDPQNDLPFHVYYSNFYKVNLILLLYNSWTPLYKKRVKCKVDSLPWSSSDLKWDFNKDINLVYSVADSPLYPIRMLMNSDTRMNSILQTIKCGKSEYRLDWHKYIEVLNRSKILAFDNSVWNFTVLKWLEGFSTECLIMAPMPEEAEEMHFEPYKNFVPITTEDYFEKIIKYLCDEEERIRIAENGRKTFIKYHTSDIRSKQLYDKLEKLI